MSRPPRPRTIGVLAALGVIALAACSSPTTDAASGAEATSVMSAPPATAAAPPTTAAPTTTAPASTVPAPPPVPAATIPAAPTYTVTNVVDGDTVDVADSTGATSRVRLVGCVRRGGGDDGARRIGPRQAGDAHAGWRRRGRRSLRPTAALRRPDGRDAGLELIAEGHAIARYDSRDGYGRHDREASYIAADAASPDAECATPQPAAALPALASGSVRYANCDAVRAAGAAPIHPGDPGWQQKFDRDKDGTGCE